MLALLPMAKPTKPTTLGAKLLCEELERRKWNQERAAVELSRVLGDGVGQSYVSMLITGGEPRIKRALALKKLFRIPLTAWTEQAKARAS